MLFLEFARQNLEVNDGAQKQGLPVRGEPNPIVENEKRRLRRSQEN